MTILLLVIFAFFIFTMFRRNKKAQAQQAEMRTKFVPGVEVMTNFGLFGRILSVDDAENKVVLELSPGATATVHRQAVSKVVEPHVPAEGEATQTEIGAEAPGSEPSLEERPAPRPEIQRPEVQRPEAQLHETPEQTLRRLEGEGK
ncbi:preprotein translocase subunit YajC [Sinomonas terrae]|uniref:Preprotein translocase subunit YajC n=1 Tax=Sinomonas terrae TaxID=2908838 RepID=A0ABS9U0L7_9MICC|nr:preprotein translocase subunit YajC [Sinomonas terrae]MCH6470253.1 preprotein translocase subunit YajC [Sinomonas terrae]